MIKLKKEELLQEETVQKIQFDNDWYFEIDSLASYLKEDLSDVETITLPISGQYKKTATIEQVEKGRKQEPLSDFNKALLKFKDKK